MFKQSPFTLYAGTLAQLPAHGPASGKYLDYPGARAGLYRPCLLRRGIGAVGTATADRAETWFQQYFINKHLSTRPVLARNMASESPSRNKQRPGKDGDARMNPRGNYKGTREEWLEAVLAIVASWLDDAVKSVWESMTNGGKRYTKKAADGTTRLPSFRMFFALHRVRVTDIRFSCSLLSSGMKRGPHGAHVQYKQSTGNKKHEIRMGVQLNGTTKHDSIIVAGILMHEVLHTMAIGDGHRGMFPIIGKAAGLTGKPTAMMALKDTPLYDRLNAEVVSVLGRYPHKAVELNGRMAKRGQRKIGSRSIKCQCPECECIIRLTRVWLDFAAGEPVCPMRCVDERFGEPIVMVVES